MNSEIIVTRQIISLIDKYLKYYPMDQFYDNDQTTYLKTVNTYFSVSILEKYRNRLKNLKKIYREVEFQIWIFIQISLQIR
nr:MAG TPA: hypothetical protein [Caudoviricetes sp.]